MKNLLLFYLISIAVFNTISIAQVNQEWVVEFNGTGNSSDHSYAMKIDPSGNTYVTGESYTAAGNYDYVTIKYNSDGDTVWVRYYNGPANNRDVARAIDVDDNGSVYVTGESYGTGDYDIATIKYNSSGVQQWAVRYNGPAGGADGGSAITVDTSGSVYVTGYSDGDASPVFRQDDYITIKYNPSGTADWSNRYDGPGNFHDTPYAIAVDQNSNVFVTGGSSGIGSRYDYATIKYSPAGSELWVERYNGPANYNDATKAIALDDSGNVYVTGSSDGTSSDNQDFATIKYNTSGTQQWLARYDGGGGGDDAYAMVLDGSGNLFVTGDSRNPVTPFSYDYLTIRYNVYTGDTVWTARYNGPASNTDIPLSVAVDKFGSVYVTGYSGGSGTGNDYASLKYSLNGTEQWLIRYNGTGNGNDIANSIAVDTAGYVYVTGSSSGIGTADDIVTIKYSQSTTGFYEINSDLPSSYSLYQNYPNPFNPSTTITFSIPSTAYTSLKVYDILGNEVATLVDEEKPAGRYEVNFSAIGGPASGGNAYSLSSGVYLYRLHAGNFIATKKFLLMK